MISEETKQALRDSGYVFQTTYVLETNSKEGEPTLEDLIEACGNQFGYLNAVYDEDRKEIVEWNAVSIHFVPMKIGRGTIPKEAVASLFVEINKK